MEFLSCIRSNYSESGKLGGIYTLRLRSAVFCFLSWQQEVSKFSLLPSNGTQHLKNCEKHFHETFGTATAMFTHNNGDLSLFFLVINTAATSRVKNVFNEHCKITQIHLMPNTLRRQVFRV